MFSLNNLTFYFKNDYVECLEYLIFFTQRENVDNNIKKLLYKVNMDTNFETKFV